MTTRVVIPMNTVLDKSPSTHDTDCSTIHSQSESLPSESLSEAICRCVGSEVMQAVKQTVWEAAGEEWSPGIGLWAAVETAYFSDVKRTDLKRNGDEEEFSQAFSRKLLGDLGNMSLEDMEVFYRSSLASTHTRVLTQLWELYESLPASLLCITPGPLINSVQSPAFQVSAASFLRYLETHPKLSNAEEETCAICNSPESFEDNLIVICSQCELAVHANCYKIGSIPEGDWLCEPCKNGVSSPVCCLCLQGKGAMYRAEYTESAVQWAHITCAELLPSATHIVTTASDALIQLTQGFTNSPFPCSLCGLTGGKLLNCDYKCCFAKFHPSCWRRLILAQGGQPLPPVFCGVHNHDGLRAALEESANQQTREITKLWHRLVNCAREDVPRKRRKTSC